MNFYPELPAAAQEKFVQKTNFKVGEIIQLAGLDWYVAHMFRGFVKLVSKRRSQGGSLTPRASDLKSLLSSGNWKTFTMPSWILKGKSGNSFLPPRFPSVLTTVCLSGKSFSPSASVFFPLRVTAPSTVSYRQRRWPIAGLLLPSPITTITRLSFISTRMGPCFLLLFPVNMVCTLLLPVIENLCSSTSIATTC